MKKYIKVVTVIGVTIFAVAASFYLIGKYILPDILGDVYIEKEAPYAVAGENILNKRAPAFNLSNMSGDRVALSDFFGTPVVVTFWATWDAQSTDQIEIINTYLRAQKDQAKLVNVIAVNSQEDKSIALSFMKRGGYSVPVLFDTVGDISKVYAVKSLPVTYFISREGVVREVYTGILSQNLFVEKIDSLLKQKGVE